MKKFNLLFASALALLTLSACGGKKTSSTSNEEILLGSKEETQLTFEEKYIEDRYSYSSGGKFALSILSNVGSICAGVGFNSPVAVVSGVFGIISSFGDNFAATNGPTTQDIMNKLDEMDTKLDAINATLNENYSQLMSETVRTQAMVDKVLLEEQESAITNFYTTYAMPIENHERDFADYLEQSLKLFVSDKQSVSFYVHKNEEKNWALNSLLDVESAKELEITVNIDSFSHTSEFLEKNFNTVTKGFMDNLYQDLENGIASATLPEGLSTKDACDFLAGNVIENITKTYYVEHHDKALELRNNVINYSKSISGKTGKSVIDRYVLRMQYMYNFAGEIKNTVTDLFSNIKQTLKTNVALASQACAYASVNQDEIRSEFIDAEDAIRNNYEAVKGIKDNYCFLTNTLIGGGFYRARFQTGYTNKGNDCAFNAAFKLDKVVAGSGSQILREDDIRNHNILNNVDHLRIHARMDLMRQLGIVDTANYIEYLVDANAVSKEDYDNFKQLRSNKWLSNDALRFLTDLTTRDMNDGDKNFSLTCNEAGNPGGDYFNVGWTGTFRSSRTSSCWNGKVAETTFIDANTGTIQSNKRVAAYATYAESHWNWLNDEYWSFVDNTVGNYFFILENVAE